MESAFKTETKRLLYHEPLAERSSYICRKCGDIVATCRKDLPRTMPGLCFDCYYGFFLGEPPD